MCILSEVFYILKCKESIIPPSQPSNNDHLEIISDILDKMIDLQSTNVQNLSEIKSSMHEALRLCDETNHFFSNGFRAEIKNHVSMEVRLLQSQMQDLSRNSESISRSIDEINMFLKRPTTWLKIAVMLIVSISTATGAIGGCYYAIHQQFSSHTKTNETISVQETKSTNTN